MNVPRYLLSLILLLPLMLAGCAGMNGVSNSAGEYSLPPITTSPTGESRPGAFVWHDLLTPDVSASREYYAGLFGWTFRENGSYTEIYLGEQKIGGMLPIKPGEGKPAAAQWLASVSVADVNTTASQVADSDGRIINGPMDLGARGRGVLIAGPSGGHLLLLQSKSGDPADIPPAVNSWLWNELWTTDLQPAVDFYAGLLGYQHKTVQDNYVILSKGGQWQAGIHKIQDKAFAGRWVPVVRVADPQPLLDKAESLGGKVWVRPGESKGRPDAALISDNQGAMVILQRWSADTKSKEAN
ncbi:VOC family protein [Thiolapillus sp.]